MIRGLQMIILHAAYEDLLRNALSPIISRPDHLPACFDVPLQLLLLLLPEAGLYGFLYLLAASPMPRQFVRPFK